mmetsp:Transcript_27359/g.20508  ORF Transcript_27359/g.20508 Transcript_27359/m.20508 type:complete len:86 (+) Transcript_27359:237-494(+)
MELNEEEESEEEGSSEEESSQDELSEEDKKSEDEGMGKLDELKDSDEDLDFALEKLHDYESTSKVARAKKVQASEAERGKAIRVQ